MKDLKLKQLLLAVLLVLIITAPAVLADDTEPRQNTTGPEPPKDVQERDVIKALGIPPIAPVVIGGVPDYTWRHGCGPTALGNVVGYYDGQGYVDLIPGDASIQTADVNQVIASGGTSVNPNPLGFEQHYEDFARPEDPLPGPLLNDDYITAGRTPHLNDSVGDYMDTSKSTRTNRYGWSWDTDVGPAFVDYVNMKNSAYAPSFTRYRWSALTWSILTNEIDNGRPMVFLVDTNGDGDSDHFVTIVGYDTATGQYGCHDTWAPAGVRWESFQGIAGGNSWGIYSGISFQLAPIGIKWKQPPDETENGIDIRCDRSDGIPRVLADDFKCTTTGQITTIVFWGSWKNDIKGNISNIHLSIHDDLPANDPANPNNYSVPRTVLWTKDVGPANFNEMVHSLQEPEWCWDPATGQPPIRWCDSAIWKYVIPIDPSAAFTQEGDPCNPVVYWLDIHVTLEPDDRNPEFGWKTTPPDYHWNDDAVWSNDDGAIWKELIYPSEHPYAPGSVDLAFAIVTEEPEQPNEIKWSQPPKPTETDNLYYGWNEISEYDGDQIVADDWLCDNDDPVTDIHWWGSFKDWKGQEPPLLPERFHITFWTDVPDPNPDDPDTFSHPNDVVWEIDCTNFDYRFVGWDYDPRTNCYEACFLFEQYLTEAEYFYQKPSPDGTPSVYWISIAAVYPDGTIVDNPWGWKARPRMFNDDAVQIRIPTNPKIGDKYVEGKPIYWPDPDKSWDMAFELTAQKAQTIIKWEQDPNPQLPGLHCHDSQDAAGNYSYITIADDWKCQGGDVTDLHWYGNYEMDALNQEIRGSGVRYFHLSIHNPVAVAACMPQPTEIRGYDVPFTAITEIDTGLVNLEGCKIYLYEYVLPEPFPQEIDQSYWLDITAFANDPMAPPLWRWQEAQRGPLPILCGAVTRTGPPPTPWQTIWPGDPERYSDMAFAITSTGISEVYVKWSQPPEPYMPEAYDGWNEVSVYNWQQIAADDWFCDTANPVTDIHWWGSFLGWSCEEPPEMPESFHIAIWTDVPAGVDQRFSHPGVVIWETNCNNFTSKFVGWDIDPRDPYAPPETCYKFEQDLPEKEWFYQQHGGNVYWLSIAAKYPAGTEVQHPWGWKTRPRDLNSRAPDDAVKIFDPTAPILGSIYLNGMPLWWPTEDDSWDLAFELTTKEIPPKPPIPHLKWSQPPVEIDPSSEIPVYSGWDEPSFVADIAGTPGDMSIVADDFRCLGSMPVTSLHWWGSYFGLVEPGTVPPQLPIAWNIGFWTNVPESADTDYSYPEKLLWNIRVPANRVDVEMVGRDSYHGYYPEDIAFQYTLYLDPNEFFWQGDYLEDTIDDVFWLSIVAIYDPDVGPDIVYPWGWKTRPWSWMDDAVRFIYDGPLEPGMILDPLAITPIKDPIYRESFDVAFELDTDPNYIKWEQPFTGIRNWPHYEDEVSMATMVTTTEVVTKWLQNPDLSDMGVDVDATFDLMGYFPPQLLADDYKCETTEAVTGINIYGSWWHDLLPTDPFGSSDPTQVMFTLSFHKDIPADQSPTGYSMPGDVIWWRPFNPGEFFVELVPPLGPESYYMPCSDIFTFLDHQNVWKYSFSIPASEAFIQQGTEDRPVIYWLDVQAVPQDITQNPEVRFGWKTSEEHWNDDATWVVGMEPYNGDWNELRYPPGHPYVGESIDLAFELTTERVNTEFVIDRLVADDWKCERRTPVTDVVWWGSYLGYEFKPCHGNFMPLPIKPDYFLLAIWTDIPADADSTVPFSHPNEIVWEYKAHDYDEVLVGYDKHPEGLSVAICGAPSDPNWNTDVQTKLLATGQFKTVDIITVNTITPTLTQLQTYNSVLVYSDAIYADAIALGNVMADYVDSGGGVVCAMFEIAYGSGPLPHPTAQMKGRWDTQGYYAIPRTAQFGPPQATLGTVYNPAHPIMQGVSGFDGGINSFRPISTTIIPLSSTRVADWSDGSPLVVTKTIGGVPRADIGLYPPSSDVRSDFWLSSTDGALLMANALTWVASSTPIVSPPREPVFRYSVRLPQDEWFKQRDVNDIYWFSVVAVYDKSRPNYDWGWTNHPHVFNDDAVAGNLDLATSEWSWIELLDQTENSEDMSFILFTDPKECVSCADYNADSIVNFKDYSDFADDWNWSGMPGGYNKSDLNCNGVVDNNDLNIFTMQWLSSCP